MNTIFANYLNKQTSSYSLSVFRFLFGLLMSISIVRFWLKGWIKELYLNPTFHFSYSLFEWVKPIGEYTYLLFLICFISALLVCIGLKYRLSIIVFFLSFTYIELMDKTTYLNHYYFVSLVSFLLIFLPANLSFSVDAILKKTKFLKIPQWYVDSIKFLISIVYLYAAIAKINSDWLIEAMPLKIWISSKYHYPLVGDTLFQQEWFYYLMSWGGFLYDLFIPLLLIYSRTRLFAFVMVIIFHVLTKILFPIGMFPYIMIISAIIFFSSKTHEKIAGSLSLIFDKILSNIRKKKNDIILDQRQEWSCPYKNVSLYIVIFFLFLQLIIPFRHILYPGELLWHEQGYRFSWRVMLVEKVGIANFKIVNKQDQTFFYVRNSNFLTPFQEKQMSFQPDFILEYAHYLGDYHGGIDNDNIQVFVDNYVTLNGRKSQRLVSDKIDLYSQKKSCKNKQWIIPLKDEIKGF